MEQSILKNKTILIVDDYFINTELLSLFVLETGAIPLTASNGKECVEIIKEQHVDIILMDGNMPVMNGIEATKAVRALPQGKNIAIVGFSGNDEKENADAGIQAGMNLIVAKLSLNKVKLFEIAEYFFGDSEGTPKKDASSGLSGEVLSAEPIKSASGQAVIDYKKALHEFENDNDLLVSLIVDFNRIINSQHTLLQQALARSDYECIRREVHGIKGGAANICAMPLSEAAQSLEAACRHGAEKETVACLFDKFSVAVDSFDQYVRTNLVNAS